MERTAALRHVDGHRVIVAWPVTVVGPPELPELAPKAHPAPLIAAVVAIQLFIVAAATVTQAILAQGWPGENAARSLSLLAASARLYPDPGLFDPRQLFSAAMVHDPVWGGLRQVLTAAWAVVVDSALLLTVGRAWERSCGTLGLAGLLLLAMPLVGIVHLRHVVQADPVITSAALVTAVIAATAMLLPGRRLRITLAYWLIAVVGVAPLYCDLRLLIGLYVVSDCLRTWLADPTQLVTIGTAHIAAIFVGVMLGSLARPIMKRK